MRTFRISTALSVLGLAALSACGADEVTSGQPPATPPPSTVPSAPSSTPTTIAAAVVATTAPATSPTSPPTSAAAAAPESPGSTNCDTPGVGGYDLLDYAVEQTADALVLTAVLQPIEPGHDVLISFTTPGSSKRVAGELFEDGSGVAQIQDLATLDTVYLDGPQEFASDYIRLTVPQKLVDSRLVHAPLTVELKVDGSTVESCAPRSA